VTIQAPVMCCSHPANRVVISKPVSGKLVWPPGWGEECSLLSCIADYPVAPHMPLSKKMTVANLQGIKDAHTAARNASRYLPLTLSVRRIDKTDEPVLAPTFIVGFGTDGVQLSPSSTHLDAALAYAPAYQRLFHPVGTPLRKPEIVEPVSPRRCVSVDVEPHIGVILQPSNIAFENTGVRRIIVVVVREQDDLHVLVKSLFFGTEHNYRRPGPVIDPISDIRLWFCRSYLRKSRSAKER
jgi:hypothetical protein